MSVQPIVAEIRKLSLALIPSKPRPKRVVNRPKLIASARYLQALQNPFHADVAGVKVPDFDGNLSFTVASKDLFSISSDANGYSGGAIVYFDPAIRNVVSASNTLGAVTLNLGTLTAWTDFTGQLAVTQAIGSRLVAGGFRITNLMSIAGTAAASGRLVIAPISEVMLSALLAGGTYTEALLRKQPGCLVIPLSALAAAEDPVVGYTGPLDPSAQNYIGTNIVLLPNVDQPNFVNFIYLVTGAPPSIPILEIESVAHWEALPNLTNGSLVTAGIVSDISMMDRAYNYMQTTDAITWAGKAYNFVAQASENYQLRHRFDMLNY